MTVYQDVLLPSFPVVINNSCGLVPGQAATMLTSLVRKNLRCAYGSAAISLRCHMHFLLVRKRGFLAPIAVPLECFVIDVV